MRADRGPSGTKFPAVFYVEIQDISVQVRAFWTVQITAENLCKIR